MKKKEHVEILLEDINSKFALVLEGHESLRSDIRHLREETMERLEVVECHLGALNQKIDKVDERLSQKIDRVDERLSQKIDKVDERLSQKIESLGQKIESLGQKIDAVAADLKAHRADTEIHRTPYRVSEP